MSDPVLASDAEREKVAERLRVAAGEGRLTSEELEERLERALGARTDAELAETLAGLPAERERGRARPRAGGGRKGGPLRTYVFAMALLVAIWALTGMGYFWPVWPMLGWGIALVPHGPGPRCGRHTRSRACSAGPPSHRQQALAERVNRAA